MSFLFLTILLRKRELVPLLCLLDVLCLLLFFYSFLQCCGLLCSVSRMNISGYTPHYRTLTIGNVLGEAALKEGNIKSIHVLLRCSYSAILQEISKFMFVAS